MLVVSPKHRSAIVVNLWCRRKLRPCPKPKPQRPVRPLPGRGAGNRPPRCHLYCSKATNRSRRRRAAPGNVTPSDPRRRANMSEQRERQANCPKLTAQENCCSPPVTRTGSTPIGTSRANNCGNSTAPPRMATWSCAFTWKRSRAHRSRKCMFIPSRKIGSSTLGAAGRNSWSSWAITPERMAAGRAFPFRPRP